MRGNSYLTIELAHFPAFGLEVKYWFFLGLKPAGLRTGIYTISSPGSQAFWLRVKLYHHHWLCWLSSLPTSDLRTSQLPYCVNQCFIINLFLCILSADSMSLENFHYNGLRFSFWAKKNLLKFLEEIVPSWFGVICSRKSVLLWKLACSLVVLEKESFSWMEFSLQNMLINVFGHSKQRFLASLDLWVSAEAGRWFGDGCGTSVLQRARSDPLCFWWCYYINKFYHKMFKSPYFKTMLLLLYRVSAKSPNHSLWELEGIMEIN